MHKKNILFLVSIIAFLFGEVSSAQNQSIDFSSADFINLKKNVIKNDGTIAPFLNKLNDLKNGKKIKVNVLHVGDSHIQADFLTQTVRQNIQADFGNAGRGMVMPFKVGRTNEPNNFATSSPNNWESKRCCFPNLPLPIGISGLTIKTDEVAPTISIKTYNYPPLNYEFNYIRIFHEKGDSYNGFTVNDSLGNPLKVSVTDGGSFLTLITLPLLTNKINLVAIQDDFVPKATQLYGLSLENSQPGVLYHAIGINGAEYQHYNKAENFVYQTQYLKPDLFIISLGTNEGQASLDKFSPEEFKDNVNMLVRQLKKTNPGACFILATPPDSFKKKKYKNTILTQITKIIIDCARANNCAYWNFYTLAPEGAKAWKKKGLMQGDGVHFTKAGYQLQGNLLYSALYKSYTNRNKPTNLATEEDSTINIVIQPMEKLSKKAPKTYYTEASSKKKAPKKANKTNLKHRKLIR